MTENQPEANNTSLSTPAKFTQADIPTFLEQVKSKIATLTAGKSTVVTITKLFPGLGDLSKIDVLQTLIQAYSSITGKQAAYNKAAEECLPEGIKAPTMKIEGHSSEEWKAFIKERIVEVAHKRELEKLRKIQKTLEENLSAEAKLANDLKNIHGMLTADE